MYGKKRWQLWAPARALPTAASATANDISEKILRIPYEESSIYNEYDPMTCEIAPDYDITLSPGDILVVPKHWWHFVSTESDVAFSVNSWQEVEGDSADRLSEAMTRFCLGAMLSALADAGTLASDDAAEWLSPSEIKHHHDRTSEEGPERGIEEDKAASSEGFGGLTCHEDNYAYLVASMVECGIVDTSENFVVIKEKMKRFVNKLICPDVIRGCLESKKAVGMR